MAAPFRIVIPARFASTRLPAKPLADICGKPMIVRVLERVQDAGALETWVATDHAEVRDAVLAAGGKVVMTRADHPSGTDRLAEVAELRGWADGDIVVNVQGDEPLVSPALIHEVAQNLADHAAAAIATAAHPLHDTVAMMNPNVVKVVLDKYGYALYFSRAPIPYARDAYAAQAPMPEQLPAYRHIGIYGYRTAFLRSYASLPPAGIETFEALEQLRALWHGYRISVAIAAVAPATGVDTAEDLQRVRELFAQKR